MRRVGLSIFLLGTLPLFAQTTARYINVGQAASALVELPQGAILIDAGGETDKEDAYGDHLIDYLEKFFAKRTDLQETLTAVIISHPHIDHTKYLMDVLETFKVKNLIDGGDDAGSGIAQLKKAREFARANGIKYRSVSDTSVRARGLELRLFGQNGPIVTLLSGSRDCENGNNNSLGVRIKSSETTLLFTGDAEVEGDQACDTGQLEHLRERFAGKSLLKADIYLVAHHGSSNGTSADFLAEVKPSITVISAGIPQHQTPGPFHAFQFGHPRQDAVTTVMNATTGMRTAKAVTVLPKVKTTAAITMTNAVYCTCWDGDVEIAYARNATRPTVTTTGFQP